MQVADLLDRDREIALLQIVSNQTGKFTKFVLACVDQTKQPAL